MDDHEHAREESIKTALRHCLHIGSLVWLTQALLVFTLVCALYVLAHCENNIDPNGDLEQDTHESSMAPLPAQSAVKVSLTKGFCWRFVKNDTEECDRAPHVDRLVYGSEDQPASRVIYDCVSEGQVFRRFWTKAPPQLITWFLTDRRAFSRTRLGVGNRLIRISY